MEFVSSSRQLKALIFYVFLATISLFLPFLSLASFLVRCLVALSISIDPGYGKMLAHMDVCFDENFVDSPPKATIMTVLSLEGTLSLQELCDLFRKHVLDASLPYPSSSITKASKQARYPEFTQFITTRWGFRVWKNELNFRLDDHIKERYLDHIDLSEIHEELINKPFKKRRSPWEIYLIQRHDEDQQQLPNTCVLALKMHHTMADAKSILKIIVERLGQKKLRSVDTPRIVPSFREKALFHIGFPLNFAHFLGRFAWYSWKSSGHPWKTFINGDYQDDLTSDDVPLVVRLSPEISLIEVKQVAKQNRVMASSVILCAIGGAIGKYDLRGNEVFVGFTQPKENHPNRLSNHFHTGILMLPTTPSNDRQSATSRLQLCHDRLWEMKRGQWVKFSEVVTSSVGLLFNSWQKIIGVNYYCPVGITNIAGELDGCMIGNAKCLKFTMSVGTLPGCAGVAICVFSYKDIIRIAVAAKETVLSGERAEQLGKQIVKEFNALS